MYVYFYHSCHSNCITALQQRRIFRRHTFICFSRAILHRCFFFKNNTCSCCVLLCITAQVKGKELRGDKRHWYTRPVSLPARPVQSTGTPAGIHSDSLYHRQGHKIFHRDGSKQTAAKKGTDVAQMLFQSQHTTQFQTHKVLVQLANKGCRYDSDEHFPSLSLFPVSCSFCFF